MQARVRLHRLATPHPPVLREKGGRWSLAGPTPPGMYCDSLEINTFPGPNSMAVLLSKSLPAPSSWGCVLQRQSCPPPPLTLPVFPQAPYLYDRPKAACILSTGDGEVSQSTTPTLRVPATQVMMLSQHTRTDWRSVQYSALSPDSEGGRSPEKGESHVIGVIRESFPEEEKLGQELEVCGGWEEHSGQAPEERRKPY